MADVTVTPLRMWEPDPDARFAPLRCPACRVQVGAFGWPNVRWTTIGFNALLDTGELHTVFAPPAYVKERGTRTRKKVFVDPTDRHTEWNGIPCVWGRFGLILPTLEPPGRRQSFTHGLILSEPVPDLPFRLHLGGNFLAEAAARLELDYAGPEPAGRLVVPG